MNPLITTLTLLGALALSLFGNAWQWANRSEVKATAKGDVARVVEINHSNDDALSRVSARMWELAGESAQLEVANKRGEEKHAALEKQLLIERRKRAKEIDDAYNNDDCKAWGSAPVCPAVSRVYTGAGGADKDRGSARRED